ncbi:class I adenylate-forming enzyme family protein [Limimaricola pyoseonensis]|uniref:Acyl-CoA synthetase (AMP-forming)/AMP-acid ligase II n=1 Tax=Limimaricola pyoseonensis TaxID=521013 RepID=A0A1G7JDN3_9RHOB|nr:class I adenylate-forming enzyme family protein [Limimaricola pyoseonensis]SDF22589.1 Acyl-CoA synthetase (AMP-forming)/AMP-acid ligase II [Limimaricola pyoseonensis]
MIAATETRAESGATARIDALIARHAAERPQAQGLIDSDGRVFDWAGYEAAVAAMADLLRDRGLATGDRLLIVAENCAATALSIFAAARLGAIAVPVNARMTTAEIARITNHAEPRLVAYTTNVSPEAQAHADAAGAEAVESPAGRIAIAQGPGGAADPEARDVAVILYTTGTTGDPKGVMLTHANLRFAGNASSVLRDMVPGDRIYGALPLTHVFGLASMLMAGATCGAAIRLETRFAPDKLLAALQDGATVLPAVPQMHALLMKHVASLGLDRLEGAQLRYVSSGAAPLDPAWKRKAEAFYGLPLQNGYGMTESTAGVCGTKNPIGTPDVSVGPALPGIEIRIDPEAQDAEGVGEIHTRGPHVMKGYFRNPDETAKVLGPDGWLKTGDLGKIDAEGRLHVVGRCKELIIRSGFNVYPPEVEAALNDHPAVVQAAVIGRARHGNEEVLAFVQCADPAPDAATLKAHVTGRLSSYKRPSKILIVDRLPAAATGKILKHKLLDAFADRLAALDAEEK